MTTARASSPPATPTPASPVSLLPPHRPSLPRFRLRPPLAASAAAAAFPISLGFGCRPLPSVRCQAAAGPSPPSSEPPPPSPHGWQERLSRLQDRARIFFAVLFWMSLFFWGSAWDGSNNSGGKKRQRFRKKSK
ncbi:proline-rich receptor-like protein kinase PERK14 [Phragmites australis]|uniref:proline-rich receptor-like protein kinase PERK14 n=1 Tax=Phragmites australis TaxID=29695 RepID=UPI002D784BB9|nr:proline-rich receptor-like protein kinase PERK14 [Phragmites australis]